MRMDSKKRGQCDYCGTAFIGNHLCEEFKKVRIASFKSISKVMTHFVDSHVPEMEDFTIEIGETRMRVMFERITKKS